MKDNGYKVVLSSDRTLFSEYHGGIFLGFSACFPTSLINKFFYYTFFCPSIDVYKNGAAKLAPRSLRLIQSKLLQNGLSEDEIVVAHPRHLNKVVGPRTKVLGLSEQDPLGIGPATSTFTNIFGGEAYMSKEFSNLLNYEKIKKHNPHVVVGGAGAWQLDSKDIRERKGVDSIVLGEAEEVVTKHFKDIINGKEVSDVVEGKTSDVEEIPSLSAPTLNGLVEISRGCGRGCSFCPLSDVKRRDLPKKQIIADIKINLKAGKKTPILHAEDILKYKSGQEINEKAVTDLFQQIKSIKGIKFIDISHFSVSSVIESPGLVEKISKILNLGQNQLFLGGQVGIETGSPRLIEKHMKGKTGRREPKEWPNMVVNAFKVLSKNNWVPAATILMGLPGEREEDVLKNIELIEELKNIRSLIVPLSYVSVSNKSSFNIKEASPLYKKLFKKCWKHNFSWMNSLYNDYSDMYLDSLRSIPTKFLLKFAKKYYTKRLKKVLK